MTSLRARIALFLVLSIVGVVGLATLIAFSTLRGPPPEGLMMPVAHQIQLMTGFLEGEATRDRNIQPVIRAQPAEGAEQPSLTRVLSLALRRVGIDTPVRVTRQQPVGTPTRIEGRDTPQQDMEHDGSFPLGMTASVQLKDGRWMIVDVPDFGPPRTSLVFLFSWMGLILLGAIAIALYFAALLSRPLRVLEAAVQRVGRDGVLAALPEEGTAEVRATARTLNQLSGRLKTAMESRMRLVAAAGHDLRTPMTRMRLRAEFLPDEEREKWLTDLEELDRIADSAIRLVREEVEHDDRAALDLDLLVRELALELKGQGMPVLLGRLDAARVRAGRLGLTRALRNLVANGATHGKGCSVEMLADCRTARVIVTDDGPGIPSELIDRAFEPFFRVDPARRKSVPGAGLGLAIAREIVERYDGELTLANRPQGGLVQTVTFARDETDG